MAVRPIDGNELVDTLKQIVSDYTSHGMYPSVFPVEYAIEIVEKMPTLTPQNEPLTLDKLRKMDGEPVYVVPVNEFSELGKWCVLSVDNSDDYSCALVPGIDCWAWRFEAYGETWFAYRRPPEGACIDKEN